MQGKRVLVTGSSRGIGRAIALRLANDGCRVALHYVADKASAEETASILGEASAGVYQADLADPAEVDPFWATVLSEGPVHVLVNNAGIYKPEPFETMDPVETMRVNLFSPMRLTQLAVHRFLSEGEPGKILMVGSRVGFKGEAGASVYAASKAALLNLVRSLAVEYADRHIGFFGIAPGWVETAMVRQGMEDRMNDILKTLPLGRMATPEDCAATVAFLLSDEAAYLSGQTIDINGASYFH
ncbi:3-oxoacyl-ACP reductase FabG [soil metagenome]